MNANTHLYQSAINFSEGRDKDRIFSIVQSMDRYENCSVADWSADVDHNRSVITLIGGAEGVKSAAMSGIEKAISILDIRNHTGVHPYTGVVDVLPITPVRGCTMKNAVTIAHQIGAKASSLFQIPVYYYGWAAEKGRPGELPLLRKMWKNLKPDTGPERPNVSAGIIMIGAREALAAYNMLLDSSDLHIAAEIARVIRHTRSCDPVLAGVRALGLFLASRNKVQISMNLTNLDDSSLPDVFKKVSQLAEERGIRVVESEVVGLIPQKLMLGRKPEEILWTSCRLEQFLEKWL